MAEQITQTTLPAPFIEAAGKTYLSDLATATGQFKTADLSKVYGPQFVAGQDPLQQEAQKRAISGIGAYQPYLTQAGAYADPNAYKTFMSPYQQDVIQATMDEFDVQAQKGIPSIAAQAVGQGVLGGGREGVMRSEYQSASDRNRAALQAQLLAGGFSQAQNLAQNAIANQLNLGQQQQSFLGQDVGALSTLGATNQAQRQAALTAQQQLAMQQLQQPMTAAQNYGAGVTQLIAGYPGQTQQTQMPSPSPLSTLLGTGTTLAGIYRAFNPATQKIQMIPS
tara:strand:- start:24 stop:863 length:840 start_codon:yes stop_codon:yes gene_type:complete